MYSPRSLAATLFFGGTLACSAPGQAALVLADNLTEAGDFAVSLSDDTWQAQAFSNINATQLTAVELALYNDLGATGDFAVELWNLDAGAGTPGTALHTLFSGSASALGGAGTTLVISGLNIALTPSTSYYVVARGDGLGFDELAWLYADDTGGLGFPSAYSVTDDGGGSWDPASLTEPMKLRIEATGVPLPATPGLLVLGLLALRRQRRQPMRQSRGGRWNLLGRNLLGRGGALTVGAALAWLSLAPVPALTVADGLNEPAKFRPKEFDVTIGTSAKNCQNPVTAEGLCQGGNWAQSFAYALHLSKCFSSSTPYPRLSSEDLLQCARPGTDPCAALPVDLDIVSDITTYLTSVGLPTTDCVGYRQADRFELTPSCPNTCDDASPKSAQALAASLVALTPSAVTDIQDAIISYKQSVMALRYRPALDDYQSGTYVGATDAVEFGVRFHVVVGWSTTATGEVIWKTVASRGSDYGVSGRVLISSLSADILGVYVVHPVL